MHLHRLLWAASNLHARLQESGSVCHVSTLPHLSFHFCLPVPAFTVCSHAIMIHSSPLTLSSLRLCRPSLPSSPQPAHSSPSGPLAGQLSCKKPFLGPWQPRLPNRIVRDLAVSLPTLPLACDSLFHLLMRYLPHAPSRTTHATVGDRLPYRILRAQQGA